jgi:hypothetical protein
MSTVASPPLVRHGLCALRLKIGGTWYKLRPARPLPEGFKAVWILRKQDPRAAAATDAVAHAQGEQPRCTCPDHESSNSICKHIMSLAALGLVAVPQAARPQQPRRPGRRKELRSHEETARQHLAEIVAAPADPLDPDPVAAAAGFRRAIRDQLAARKGVAS